MLNRSTATPRRSRTTAPSCGSIRVRRPQCWMPTDPRWWMNGPHDGRLRGPVVDSSAVYKMVSNGKVANLFVEFVNAQREPIRWNPAPHFGVNPGLQPIHRTQRPPRPQRLSRTVRGIQPECSARLGQHWGNVGPGGCVRPGWFSHSKFIQPSPPPQPRRGCRLRLGDWLRTSGRVGGFWGNPSTTGSSLPSDVP